MVNRRRLLMGLLAAAPLLAPGCGWFDDPTPENAFFKLDGPAGAQVRAVYSTQFVAGVDERGVTQVQMVWADTVIHTLPIDTVFDISVDRRFFVEVTPLTSPSMTLSARVDVDDRNQVNESGVVDASSPWRFAYLFNQAITRVINVVI